MSKIYIYKEKECRFSNNAFKELFEKDKELKGYKHSKFALGKIANAICMAGIQREDRMRQWFKNSGPDDISIIENLAKYFNVETEKLLIFEKNKEYENMEEIKNNEKSYSEFYNKKLNEVQKREFLEIKDMVLDYVYENYTATMWDDWYYLNTTSDSKESVNNDPKDKKELSIDICEMVVDNIAPFDECEVCDFESKVLSNSLNKMICDKYFTNEEVKKIIEERRIEKESLLNYEITPEPELTLLYEYRYRRALELCRKIDRSLSVLPIELVNQIKDIITFIPEENEYDSNNYIFDDQNRLYKSFDRINIIDKFLKNNNKSELSQDENEELMPLEFGVYNKVYIIHHFFNVIINNCF